MNEKLTITTDEFKPSIILIDQWPSHLLNYEYYWLVFNDVTVDQSPAGEVPDLSIPCRIGEEGSVDCQPLVYSNLDLWQKQTDLLEKVIRYFNVTFTNLQVTTFNNNFK